MQNIKKYFMTLALLLTAVTGAWAQDPNAVTAAEINSDLYSGWTSIDGKLFKASELPGFQAVTEDQAKSWTGVPSTGHVILYYEFVADGNVKAVRFENGVYDSSFEENELTCYLIYEDIAYMGETRYFYTTGPAPAEWDLTPDETGKKWTLAKMPASNIELQVEYEPTKVTMAANDKTMGTAEVCGQSKVEWTADTWKGWTADTKVYTVDDITMTSSQSGHIREYISEDKYNNSLFFFVRKMVNDATVTFSTTGDPFSRIEFTMIGDYSQYNPDIIPNDNWTFSGKSAVWEGEATKSLTLQSCSTNVSKITFFKGAIPDGVTVNGDGTFTVAKTATVTLKATPAEGYKFLYWEDDQTNTNPVREVTIESGMADMTYKAVFAEITYNITFADGIEEADKWKAEPNAAAKNTEVKVTYSGAKKVLGMKVEKKSEAAVSLIVNPVVGQIIGSDGKNYDANATLPDGVKAVAMIAYVGSETGDDTYKNGLAIALADEADSNWSTAKSTCEGKTAITGAKWCLPSQDQWKQMFKANGDNEGSYTGLNTTITTAGGTTLKELAFYWSSSESSPGVKAYYVNLYNHGTVYWNNDNENYNYQVRASLAF